MCTSALLSISGIARYSRSNISFSPFFLTRHAFGSLLSNWSSGCQLQHGIGMKSSAPLKRMIDYDLLWRFVSHYTIARPTKTTPSPFHSVVAELGCNILWKRAGHCNTKCHLPLKGCRIAAQLGMFWLKGDTFYHPAHL